MTIQELRTACSGILQPHPDALRDTDQIIARLFQQDISWVLSHTDAPATEQTAKQALNMVKRRAKHEPLAYILGFQPFYGRDFLVTPDVLIPRPESELIIDRIKEDLASLTNPKIIDVGTGSGCLAISAALALPEATVTAIDVSAKALLIAKENADRLSATNVLFTLGNLLEPVQGKADAIMANLPYLPQNEIDLSPTANELAYEPQLALLAGDAGLELIKRCTEQSVSILVCGGKLYLEMLPDQIPSFFVWLMTNGLPFASSVLQDLSGLNRIVVLTKTC